MAETLKSKLVLLLALLCLLFILASIKSCSNATLQKKRVREEMTTRLDLEEKMSGALRDKSLAEEKLKVKEKELAEETASRQEAQKALAQEQSMSQGLKNELQKMSDLKNSLEEQLKACKAGGKSEKRKK